MSVLHPVGPLPPRVYWVRRLVVVVAGLVVLLLLAWAWGALTGDDGGPTTAAPGGSATGSPPASPPPSTPAPSVSPSTTPSQSASPPGTPACADKVISVVATPDKTNYAKGDDPRFTVKVTNTSKKACKRDVGQKAMEVRVSQGKKIVWSSDHCAPGGEAKIVVLDPGETYATSVLWSRTTSQEGCPDDEPDAAAGTYALTGRNLTVVSDPVAFALA